MRSAALRKSNDFRWIEVVWKVPWLVGKTTLKASPFLLTAVFLWTPSDLCQAGPKRLSPAKAITWLSLSTFVRAERLEDSKEPERSPLERGTQHLQVVVERFTVTVDHASAHPGDRAVYDAQISGRWSWIRTPVGTMTRVHVLSVILYASQICGWLDGVCWMSSRMNERKPQYRWVKQWNTFD